MALRATHIVFSEALISGGLLLTSQPIPVDLVSLLGIWIGVQLPDLDTGNTRMNRHLGRFGRWLGHRFIHRTWTHTAWAIAIMFGLATWLPCPSQFDSNVGNYIRWLYLAVASGYFLHIIEDAFSYQGICWFYPFQRFNRSASGHFYRKRPWHCFYYRTGGTEEKIIRWVAFVAMWFFLIEIFTENYGK